MTDADRIIAQFGLAPHPEGGWYRETWAAPNGPDRALATCIHFLLKTGERSHWHRVDADEIWLWHAGATLTLSLAATKAGPARDHRLGGQVLAGEAPQSWSPPIIGRPPAPPAITASSAASSAPASASRASLSPSPVSTSPAHRPPPATCGNVSDTSFSWQRNSSPAMPDP